MPAPSAQQRAIADPDAAMSVEPDGEADDGKTYCFCDSVSYGEMVACDGDGCEKEWVRYWTCYDSRRR